MVKRTIGMSFRLALFLNVVIFFTFSLTANGQRAARQDYGREGVADDLYEGYTKLQDKYLSQNQPGTVTTSTETQALRVENTGAGHGIFSQTASTVDEMAAVYGLSTGTSGNTKGIVGITHSPGSPSGTAVGVYGWSQSFTAVGGSTMGVLGRTSSVPVPGADTSVGVFGWGDVASGRTYGVWGETASSTDAVSGVYGVNTAATGLTCGVIGVVNSTTPGAAGVLGVAPNNGSNVRALMGYCHAASGHAVYSDGNLTVAPGYTALADGWTIRSSRRWKTNIAPIEGALDKIERLRGVSFEWKADGKPDIGLIAEEVGQVIPEAVTCEADSEQALAVDYARLVPVLIEAIKAQQQEIRALKTEVEALRDSNAALKRLLNSE